MYERPFVPRNVFDGPASAGSGGEVLPGFESGILPDLTGKPYAYLHSLHGYLGRLEELMGLEVSRRLELISARAHELLEDLVPASKTINITELPPGVRGILFKSGSMGAEAEEGKGRDIRCSIDKQDGLAVTFAWKAAFQEIGEMSFVFKKDLGALSPSICTGASPGVNKRQIVGVRRDRFSPNEAELVKRVDGLAALVRGEMATFELLALQEELLGLVPEIQGDLTVEEHLRKMASYQRLNARFGQSGLAVSGLDGDSLTVGDLYDLLCLRFGKSKLITFDVNSFLLGPVTTSIKTSAEFQKLFPQMDETTRNAAVLKAFYGPRHSIYGMTLDLRALCANGGGSIKLGNVFNTPLEIVPKSVDGQEKFKIVIPAGGSKRLVCVADVCQETGLPVEAV